jgi:hypothetical protein
MRKSNIWLGSLFSENEVFTLQYVAVNAQNVIDEQRNVKQPPRLLGLLNLGNKFYNPQK